MKAIIFIWGVGCLFFGAAFPVRPAAFYAIGDQIKIVGQIEVNDEEKFLSKLTKRTKRVVIQSAGGNMVAAIRIGEMTSARNLSIEVDDYCMSACASAIFFAASGSRIIRPNSFLAFHGGVIGVYRKILLDLRRRTSAESDPVFSKAHEGFEEMYFSYAKEYEQLLQEAGVGKHFLPSMDDLTVADEFTIEINPETKHISVKAIADPKYMFWIPDRQGLLDLGIVTLPFERPAKDRIAKFLHVSPDSIYWDSLPVKNLLSEKSK